MVPAGFRILYNGIGKGRDISTAIADIIDYVKNPQKTDFGKFIYGYECDTRTADAEFLLSKRQYANLTGRSRGADLYSLLFYYCALPAVRRFYSGCHARTVSVPGPAYIPVWPGRETGR